MNLHNLEPSVIEKIIESIEDSNVKQWIQLQYEEQKKGGAWKARIREQGFVI